MQVVIAASSLTDAGGTQSYSVTISDHLQRLGHDVWLYSPELGEVSASAERLGVRVVGDIRALPPEPDGLVVQDAVVSYELAAALTRAPQVYVAHSDGFDLQIPPQVAGVVAVVVTMYDRVDRRIRALGLPCPIVRLTQPVDVERFKPRRAPRREAPVALMLSNYVHGQRLELLARACRRAGVDLRHIGGYSPDGQRPSDVVLNEADIVFGKARVIHEAMACGRAAYVFDHNGGDGWVTPANYEALVADNFGGQTLPEAMDEERLVRDLGEYDPDMGIVNRDLMVANHAATKHAAALVDVLRRLGPREAPVDAPLSEMARLVRLYHRADLQAFSLRAEFDQLGARAHESGVALLHAQAEADRWRAHAEGLATGAELEASRRELHELAEQVARLERELAESSGQRDAVIRTRRWRTVQAVLAPADRLRALRRPATVPPAPFIVGVARSGTTLLRLQLNAHPKLLIGPETGFGFVLDRLQSPACEPAQLLEELKGIETWPDLRLDESEVLEALTQMRPWSPAAGVRVLYELMARREGKPRWGDKTPAHLMVIPALGASLPEARFVHIIRDGRDVAASMRDVPFKPGNGSIEAVADAWRDQILLARRDAGHLPQYREVRYERLVSEPESALRDVCEFVELDFDRGMLSAHEHAGEIFARLPGERQLGAVTVTRAQRTQFHALLFQPPDPSRIGRWREVLTPSEVRRFEQRAGHLLVELGYAVSAST